MPMCPVHRRGQKLDVFLATRTDFTYSRPGSLKNRFHIFRFSLIFNKQVLKHTIVLVVKKTVYKH